ncbi:MAG: UDP-N-acetylmuramate dehydrogenase [Deltaproteobacteria bacterium]|nr:UDP-N-acetylmuramate dehydrogenase [Deltaproteobacteria bacterium]
MNVKDLFEKKVPHFSGKSLWDESMQNHTSLKVGGWVQAVLYPAHELELEQLLTFLHAYKIPFYVFGDGSNVLFMDERFEGVVINVNAFQQLSVERTSRESAIVFVGAGLSKQKLLFWAIQHGWGGLEFLAGIPGQVGGGIYMNAGTHLGDFSRVVKKVYLITKKGEKLEREVSEKDFCYRGQHFCKDHILIGADLQVVHRDPAVMQTVVSEMIQERKRIQPLKAATCGSTFKNPNGNYAGKIIEACGLKGLTIGGAMISKKHANFIENINHARAADVFQLMNEVKNAVRQQMNVELQEEVMVVRS